MPHVGLPGKNDARSLQPAHDYRDLLTVRPLVNLIRREQSESYRCRTNSTEDGSSHGQ